MTVATYEKIEDLPGWVCIGPYINSDISDYNRKNFAKARDVFYGFRCKCGFVRLNWRVHVQFVHGPGRTGTLSFDKYGKCPNCSGVEGFVISIPWFNREGFDEPYLKLSRGEIPVIPPV